jgi:hypothetical protein
VQAHDLPEAVVQGGHLARRRLLSECGGCQQLSTEGCRAGAAVTHLTPRVNVTRLTKGEIHA